MENIRFVDDVIISEDGKVPVLYNWFVKNPKEDDFEFFANGGKFKFELHDKSDKLMGYYYATKDFIEYVNLSKEYDYQTNNNLIKFVEDKK